MEHIYTTVLLNISKGTLVETQAKKIAEIFIEEIKYQAIKKDNQWQAKAYKDFYGLCEYAIKELQRNQSQSVVSMEFILN